MQATQTAGKTNGVAWLISGWAMFLITAAAIVRTASSQPIPNLGWFLVGSGAFAIGAALIALGIFRHPGPFPQRLALYLAQLIFAGAIQVFLFVIVAQLAELSYHRREAAATEAHAQAILQRENQEGAAAMERSRLRQEEHRRKYTALYGPPDPSVDPFKDGICPYCRSPLFDAVHGVTTIEDIREFARNARYPDADNLTWIHPGLYCSNGCTEILIEYDGPPRAR